MYSGFTNCHYTRIYPLHHIQCICVYIYIHLECLIVCSVYVVALLTMHIHVDVHDIVLTWGMPHNLIGSQNNKINNDYYTEKQECHNII